jgi:hypothetical protein
MSRCVRWSKVAIYPPLAFSRVLWAGFGSAGSVGLFTLGGETSATLGGGAAALSAQFCGSNGGTGSMGGTGGRASYVNWETDVVVEVGDLVAAVVGDLGAAEWVPEVVVRVGDLVAEECVPEWVVQGRVVVAVENVLCG